MIDLKKFFPHPCLNKPSFHSNTHLVEIQGAPVLDVMNHQQQAESKKNMF